jgi:hypothetical protein
MADARVTVTGLDGLVKQLKGPLFKDVNKELRQVARKIAADLVPPIAHAVAQSGAPQAHAMAATVRVHSDRVPVVAVGKVNPRFSARFKGGNTKLRRGSLAHGVVYGPLGGRRSTAAAENYYRIGRDASGGRLGHTVGEHGSVFEQATEAYLREFMALMQRHGFIGSGDDVHWGGRD